MINLETLYPVVVGGGVTNLAEPYTPHVSTSITVVDSSQLNPAPNYLSLMTDDKTIVITVKYLIKDRNTFKQLTIIESTPGAETHVFGTDTEVLRPICKVDMDDIAENIRLLNVGKQDTIDSTHKLNADYVSDGTTNKVYTFTEKNKLSGIDTGAQVNKIESIKADGTVLSITDKSVNIPIAEDWTLGLIRRATSVSTVYVSPDGSDSTGTGSQSKPWRTINYAMSQQNRQLFDGDKQYRIHVMPGDYEKITPAYKDNIVIFINGTVNINGGNNTITRSKIYIVGVPGTNPTLNITANDPSSMGIRLHGNSYLHIARLNLNISNVQYGIGSYVLESGKIDIGMNTLMLERAPTNITATTAGIFESQSGLNVYADGAITTEAGIGLRLNGGYPSISIIKTITNTSGTAYSITSPAVLSIGGKWVNQE